MCIDVLLKWCCGRKNVCGVRVFKFWKGLPSFIRLKCFFCWCAISDSRWFLLISLSSSSMITDENRDFGSVIRKLFNEVVYDWISFCNVKWIVFVEFNFIEFKHCEINMIFDCNFWKVFNWWILFFCFVFNIYCCRQLKHSIKWNKMIRICK